MCGIIALHNHWGVCIVYWLEKSIRINDWSISNYCMWANAGAVTYFTKFAFSLLVHTMYYCECKLKVKMRKK